MKDPNQITNGMATIMPASIDGKTGARLYCDLLVQLSSQRQFVWDFSRVTRVHGTGLHFLINSLRTVKKFGGSVAAVGVGTDIAPLLELVGLSEVFDRFEVVRPREASETRAGYVQAAAV
jgi:anti-anti-sigma regulatory factor